MPNEPTNTGKSRTSVQRYGGRASRWKRLPDVDADQSIPASRLLCVPSDSASGLVEFAVVPEADSSALAHVGTWLPTDGDNGEFCERASHAVASGTGGRILSVPGKGDEVAIYLTAVVGTLHIYWRTA